jgi:p-aminobenzoyl-glutamate transporter AbgT
MSIFVSTGGSGYLCFSAFGIDVSKTHLRIYIVLHFVVSLYLDLRRHYICMGFVMCVCLDNCLDDLLTCVLVFTVFCIFCLCIFILVTSVSTTAIE